MQKQILGKNVDKWASKVRMEDVRFRNYKLDNTKSNIPGNYPILIGVRNETVIPAASAKAIAKYETRTRERIPLAGFTHIEVPKTHVAETIQVLAERGVENVPVIPMELGEVHSSQYSPQELIRGNPFRQEFEGQPGQEYPLPTERPTREELERYRPESSSYRNPERAKNKWHGDGHHARDLVLSDTEARLLIESGEVESLDLEAIHGAAMTHDRRRKNDFLDKGHGEAAADEQWLRSALPDDLSDETIARIAYINRWHDADDEAVPDPLPELKIVEDADGLERVRIEKSLPRFTPRRIKRKMGLDERYLRYPIARRLVALANKLYDLSTADKEKYDRDQFGAVLDAAEQLGMLQRK